MLRSIDVGDACQEASLADDKAAELAAGVSEAAGHSGYYGKAVSCHICCRLQCSGNRSEWNKRVSAEVCIDSYGIFTALLLVQSFAHVSLNVYLCRFNSYLEGTTKARIVFTNPNTKEYCFYELTAKAIGAEVLDTIAIESPVRQTARYVLTCENPLSRLDNVTLGSVAKPNEDWWSCDSKMVKINELSTFSGNPEGSFEIEYRPLLQTQKPQECLLTVRSAELGAFKYKLVLTALPPAYRQSLQFEVPLGSMQTETLTFRAYNSAKCDYACAVKSSDFTVAKSITVDAIPHWNGEEVRLPVIFEPTEIGVVRDTLTVSSAEGGEFVFDLVAACVAPMPQGPFNVVHGKSADISFRNCFAAACTWNFATDSPAFRVNAASANVPAKSQGTCTVVFDPQGDLINTPGGIITAKLFVTCGSKPDVPPWVFYLRGKVDKELAESGAAKAAKGKK